MISIYTRTNSPFSLEYWKRTIKESLGKTSGPDAVLQSLLRGLEEANEAYELNPRDPTGTIAIVLSGKQALRDAIALKKAGKIKLLVAGPNIYVSPKDDGALIASPEVDLILVPCNWVRDLWATVAPEIAPRIAVWAAGVAPAATSTRNGPAIIYNKLATPEQAENIKDFFHKNGIRNLLLNYGDFKQKEFFTLLAQSAALIYLSASESQGLALQEAWARDVPTFVRYSGEYHAAELNWKDPKINAPYLNEYLGDFFSTNEELLALINDAAKYHPQAYCEEHFSDRRCAQNLLALL